MSTLLEQASLVMIPSGYKEDVVYSQIPTSGAGDLSFTRASNGTRINSAGLVEVVPWNMSGYSEEFNNAYWTKAGATITANDTTAPNGTTTADKVLANAANSEHGIYNATAYASNFVGEVYTYSVYAKKGTVDFLVLDHYQGSYTFTWFNLNTGTLGTVANGVTASIENVGNGWYRCSCTKAITATTLNYMGIYLSNANNTWSFNSAGTETIYIWGAQVNLATAKPYFPTTDRLNVPRLTYQNGGGGCPSLLLEKQSTNVFTYSEQFDNAIWVKGPNVAITANTTTSPDGTQNADTMTNSGPNAVYNYQLSTSASATFTASVFAKKGTNKYLAMAITAQSYTNDRYQPVFNLDDGTIQAQNTSGTNVTNTSCTISSIGNGWYRITATGTFALGSDNCYVVLQCTNNTNYNPTSGSLDFQNATNGNCYLWGAQLEGGSYATSLIPTTSASATRVADACLKTGISSLIGQTSGTIFLDYNLITASQDIVVMNAVGLPNNDIAIIFVGNSLEIYCFNNFIEQFRFSLNGYKNTNRYKIAIGYANNDVACYINGTLVGTDTSCTFNITDSIFYTSADYIAHKINQSVLFKTRLTNAELASLTTI